MKFSLRTLLVVMTLSPPLLAWGWSVGKALLTPPEREWVTCDRPVMNISWQEAVSEVKELDAARLRNSSHD